MRSKNLVVALLVVLALAVSGFTYAFWAASVEGGTADSTGTIVIGEGEDITSTFLVTNAANDTLLPMVPTGYQVALVSTNTVVLTFDVEWDTVEAGAEGVTSTLTLSALTFGGLTLADQPAYLALFSATVTGGLSQSITEGVTKTIVITVVFHTEPASQAIYEDVALGSLTLGVTFTVAPIVVA